MKIQTSFLRGSLGALMLALVAAAPAAADTFPSRPVHLIVPVSAGGWGDLSTRIVAQRLGEKLGQPVIVENRVGAGGLVGIRYVKSAPADGYTLVSTGATMAIQAALSAEPGFDPIKDFVDVGSIVRSPAVVVAAFNEPENSLAELLAKAKANPGKLSYSSAGIGTATHIPVTELLRETHVNMLHVPYKGNGAAMPDVLADRVNMMFDAYGSSASYLASGRMKALAVTSSKRLHALPDVPTVAEQGVPGFSYYYWLGLFAPAGTPPDVVKKLSAALRATLADPQLVERLQTQGTETWPSSVPEFGKFFRHEVGSIASLVQELGLPKQ
jgi:tripartite-type tricarboxylate transporter receptor subunit TctC